jgi:hypothetical protein
MNDHVYKMFPKVKKKQVCSGVNIACVPIYLVFSSSAADERRGVAVCRHCTHPGKMRMPVLRFGSSSVDRAGETRSLSLHFAAAAAAAAVARTVLWPNETSRPGSMDLDPSVMLNDPGRTLNLLKQALYQNIHARFCPSIVAPDPSPFRRLQPRNDPGVKTGRCVDSSFCRTHYLHTNGVQNICISYNTFSLTVSISKICHYMHHAVILRQESMYLDPLHSLLNCFPRRIFKTYLITHLI